MRTMAGIIQLPLPIAANTGVSPNIKTMTVTDNLATLTAAGYLNSGNLQGYTLDVDDILLVIYSYNQIIRAGTFGIFTVSISNGVITLAEDVTTGSVTFTSPSVANHMAVFSNTTGNLTDDVATAINGGNIQAGLSGTAGTLASFPATASKGSLILSAIDNTGDTDTTISNMAMGQASVISIPDPATATANFLLTPAGLVDGNIVKASGAQGLIVDAGFALKANTTAAYAGGGTSNAFTATGIGATSIVTAVIVASTNAVSIVKAVPSANTLTVDFSADPGAATQVSWIAITPAV